MRFPQFCRTWRDSRFVSTFSKKKAVLNMTSGGRITYSSLFLGLIGLVCLGLSGLALASSLSVTVQGSEIDIQAERVPLIDILKALSEKTGISLTTGDPLADPVSFHFKERSIERCLQRLLAKRNHIILYGRTEDNRLVPKGIQVFGAQAQKAIGTTRAASGPPASPSARKSDDPAQPADAMKRFTRDWFREAFGSEKELSSRISASPEPDDLNQIGIRITKVLENSAFNTIGIEQDDVIQNVNGQPVRTVQELIDLLHSVSEDQPMIRIERQSTMNRMGPLFIQLQ
jgi:hypothetical protein